MEKAKFKDVLDAWEIDYLNGVKNKLKKNTPTTSAKWMLMDRGHVLGAIRVGDELESFLTGPPDGWHQISYTRLMNTDSPMPKFPLIGRTNYRQLENFIRFYDPNFFRSKRKIKNTFVLFFDENHPIIVWIENEDLAVFIAPQVQVKSDLQTSEGITT